MKSMSEIMKPIRADIAEICVRLPELRHVLVAQADGGIPESQQSMFRKKSRAKPSREESPASRVVGFYRSPIGMMIFCKADLQCGADEGLNLQTDVRSFVKRRIFHFIPSKLFHSPGGHIGAFTIAFRPSFDRFILDFPVYRSVNFDLLEPLGFHEVYGWKEWHFEKVDFPSLRRLLGEGKISANDRVDDEYPSFVFTDDPSKSLLEVSKSE